MASLETETEPVRRKMSRLLKKLRQDIVSGQFPLGSRLPSQRQLSQEYDVSPNTVGGTMNQLAHEGLVKRIQGNGSFVAEQLPSQHRILDIVRLKGRAIPEARAVALTWAEELVAYQHGWKPYWHHVPEQDIQDVEQLMPASIVYSSGLTERQESFTPSRIHQNLLFQA